MNRYFPVTTSRVQGIGLEESAAETMLRHARAYPADGRAVGLLPAGGEYHVRAGGENHLWSAEAICKLRHAVRTDDYEAFRQYSALINDRARKRTTLRSLFRFKDRTAVPLEEVEPAESIIRRFCTAAMSFGSLSKEAHEAIAVAMNRLGARSNSGEGGEDPERFAPLPGGDSRRSAIKQVASGRFGVTTSYLVNCDEMQIKMAQGAKPGEGGQLPGHKVSEEIAQIGRAHV